MAEEATEVTFIQVQNWNTERDLPACLLERKTVVGIIGHFGLLYRFHAFLLLYICHLLISSQVNCISQMWCCIELKDILCTWLREWCTQVEEESDMMATAGTNFTKPCTNMLSPRWMLQAGPCGHSPSFFCSIFISNNSPRDGQKGKTFSPSAQKLTAVKCAPKFPSISLCSSSAGGVEVWHEIWRVSGLKCHHSQGIV